MIVFPVARLRDGMLTKDIMPKVVQ